MAVIRKSFEVLNNGVVDGLFAVFDDHGIAVIATRPGQLAPALCLANGEVVSVREASSFFEESIPHDKKQFFYAILDRHFVNGEPRSVVFMRAAVFPSMTKDDTPLWLESESGTPTVSYEFFPEEVQMVLKKRFEPMLIGGWT